jgi:hypothetical protein
VCKRKSVALDVNVSQALNKTIFEFRHGLKVDAKSGLMLDIDGEHKEDSVDMLHHRKDKHGGDVNLETNEVHLKILNIQNSFLLFQDKRVFE